MVPWISGGRRRKPPFVHEVPPHEATTRSVLVAPRQRSAGNELAVIRLVVRGLVARNEDPMTALLRPTRRRSSVLTMCQPMCSESGFRVRPPTRSRPRRLRANLHRTVSLSRRGMARTTSSQCHR